ncbi:MAG: universal stress protein [Schleiferiaceae bacterium]|jgi:nucleotide-binding universal stress UspA family protein|nr:universal stress protein [Schleiferiaceae bacterium]
MNKICVLIDFTGVCEVAVEHTAVIARQTLAQVVLVHIAPESERANEKELKEKIRAYGHTLDAEGIPFLPKIGYGEFFSTIPNFITQIDANLVVVGTHGIRGIVENLYGQNILRLVNSMPVLTMVVQGHSEAPQEGYEHMLIPLIDEVHDLNEAKKLVDFSNIFDSKITLLNYIYEDDEDGLSTDHIDKIKKQFADLNKEITYDHEETSIYVHEYSRSIMQYASIEDAQLIVWVVPKNEDHKTFNEDDKENLILNRYGIPILYSP